METKILLYGRLTKVNCEKRTAELHRFGDNPIALQFEDDLSETMQRLAARFVKVKGIGRFNDSDEWETITVHEIAAEHSELDAFRAREPKIFDPARATSYYRHDDDDPIDIEEFIRVIYEGRDV